MWILFSLLLLLVFASLLAGGNRQDDSDLELIPRRTSYSTKAGGVKALYDTLHRLDFPVRRSITEIDDSLEDGVLFIISPEVSIMDREWEALRNWVARGNTLILADNMPSTPDYKNNKVTTYKAPPVYPSFLSDGIESVGFAGKTRIVDQQLTLSNGTVGSTSYVNGKSMDSPVPLEEKTNPDIGVPLVPLFGDTDGAVVACGNWGEGKVIMIYDGWPLSNQGIGARDNFAMILNALKDREMRKGHKIIFDEFHHGYGKQKGIASLIGPSAKLGLAQLALAFLILVFSSAHRFGRPIPLMEGTRQRGEYLSSMAALLHKARAFDLVREELGKKFIKDLADILKVSPNTPLEDMVNIARSRYPDKTASIEELVGEAFGSGEGSETSIFNLAGRWYKMREELKR